jgi:hypothetical protein
MKMFALTFVVNLSALRYIARIRITGFTSSLRFLAVGNYLPTFFGHVTNYVPF